LVGLLLRRLSPQKERSAYTGSKVFGVMKMATTNDLFSFLHADKSSLASNNNNNDIPVDCRTGFYDVSCRRKRA
jgi:hypothetical protein